ncbi:hypothetical protein ACIHFE_32485 [Streptomyces sp. NPDC052396]|uniref:hypothetical protein n=1 Tax=Streptomyces sp. NPDC052396 TaxID=3365689 RepID=UPI0037D3EB15
MDKEMHDRLRVLFAITLAVSVASLGVAAVVGGSAAVWVIALPHDGFPLWMKAEQAVIGLLLLRAAFMVGSHPVRQAFAKAGGAAR